MPVEWIDFKGKKILYADFQGVKNDVENRKGLEREMELIRQEPEPVLLLVNLNNSTMSPETSQYAKDQLAALGPKVKKSALVGVTGFKTVIVDGIGRAVKDLHQAVFETVDEAKAWLVE